MVILSFNHKHIFPSIIPAEAGIYKNIENSLETIKAFLLDLAKKYPKIKSIYFSKNDSLADIAI
jgi:hypothetical protein